MEPINVFDYEVLAQARMEPAVWSYYSSGSDDEVTLRANRTAFERIRLRPRVLVDASTCDMRTTVLGTPISMPLLIAPTAFHGLAHPEGECATAGAAGRAGTLMVASTSSTRSLEDIAREARGPLWFQLYVSDRKSSEKLVHRATAAGYRTLAVTVDSPYWGRKERAIRSGFRLPPHLHKANFTDEDTTEIDTALSWESLAWLRSLTSLPIVLKGILTAEDALLAVLVGRPILWGLAVNGAEGVSHVLEILRAGLELAMALAGRPTLDSIDRSLVKMIQ